MIKCHDLFFFGVYILWAITFLCFSTEGKFGFNPQSSFTIYYKELLQPSQTINSPFFLSQFICYEAELNV